MDTCAVTQLPTGNLQRPSRSPRTYGVSSRGTLPVGAAGHREMLSPSVPHSFFRNLNVPSTGRHSLGRREKLLSVRRACSACSSGKRLSEQRIASNGVLSLGRTLAGVGIQSGVLDALLSKFAPTVKRRRAPNNRWGTNDSAPSKGEIPSRGCVLCRRKC